MFIGGVLPLVLCMVWTHPPRDCDDDCASSVDDVESVLVYGGVHGRKISKSICHILGIKEGEILLSKFADGETRIQILDVVRGREAFIVSPTVTNDSIVELFLMISALRRASAERITAIIPYYGYARQDRKFKREPVAAADVARMLDIMGVDRVVSVDLHSAQIQGFFPPTTPVDNLTTSKIAARYFVDNLKEMKSQEEVLKPKSWIDKDTFQLGSKIIVVAPQEAQVPRASNVRDEISYLSGRNIPLAMICKSRDQSGVVHRTLFGDVEGSICIVIDDLVDTGLTMSEAADILKSKGARKVYGFATHGRFSQGAKRIEECRALEYVVVTDTLPLESIIPEIDTLKKVRVLPLAELLAEAIRRIHTCKSISQILRSQK